MGNLEKESARKAKRFKIQKAILQSVAAVGVLSVALLAPNALQTLKMFGVKPHRRQREVISASRSRMVEQGLLKRDAGGFLHLTEKGKRKLRELERKDYKLPRPKKWDGKWRILVFDIPEKRKTLREKVRATLTAMGFWPLQKSVWVYPDDCEDLITLLKADFKIGRDLLYIVADKIESDKLLRERFQID